MKLGIDASSIHAGGGLTYLIELLGSVQPSDFGFSHVAIWGSKSTLDRLEERNWLHKHYDPALEGNLLKRFYWQKYSLDREARSEDCNVLFIPGGSYIGNFQPMVTMSHNMLPFEWVEARRFGLSLPTLRYLLLHLVQKSTFNRANGLVYLTEYARSSIEPFLHRPNKRTVVIPHGVDNRFRQVPRPQKSVDCYSLENPFRFLYVSIVNLYKHQWHVAEAIDQLRKRGVPVAIDFIGPAYPPALKRLEQTMNTRSVDAEHIRYLGPVSFHELHQYYQKADAFIFASSCENLPNILLEAMSAGLPIACSNRGPMPEVLGTSGLYFNPEDPADIAKQIVTLVENQELRKQLASSAYELSQGYTWNRCANETFTFLSEVARFST